MFHLPESPYTLLEIFDRLSPDFTVYVLPLPLLRDLLRPLGCSDSSPLISELLELEGETTVVTGGDDELVVYEPEDELDPLVSVDEGVMVVVVYTGGYVVPVVLELLPDEVFDGVYVFELSDRAVG